MAAEVDVDIVDAMLEELAETALLLDSPGAMFCGAFLAADAKAATVIAPEEGLHNSN